MQEKERSVFRLLKCNRWSFLVVCRRIVLLKERSFFGVGFGFFWRDDSGGGYFVLVFEVEELDAHGAAAGGADGFRVEK
jgi:hypothetical protein